MWINRFIYIVIFPILIFLSIKQTGYVTQLTAMSTILVFIYPIIDADIDSKKLDKQLLDEWKKETPNWKEFY